MQRENTCQGFPERLGLGCEIQAAVLWALGPIPPLTHCVTSDGACPLFDPQFPYL